MNPDILEYLRLKGCTLRKEGSRWVTNSPIKARNGDVDRTPSFVVFSDGGWRDFSTGTGGDIYDLRRLLGDNTDLSKLGTFVPPIHNHQQQHWDGVIPDKYLDITPLERNQITAYGASRKITKGFVPAAYFTPEYEKVLAMMFVHQDIDGVICGAKFRRINGEGRRFVMRGKPGFYVLQNGTDELFYLESETSANSLWTWAVENGKSVTVVSCGSVQQIPRQLPFPDIKRRRIYIDFDGDRELYQTRLRKYNHLRLEPFKLELPKGEDINSLYATGRFKGW